MGRRFALYYPSATAPIYAYLPSRTPLVTLADGSDLGLLQQQTADGERTSYVVHSPRRLWVRPFRGLTATDKAARDTFFNATRGLPIVMADDTLDDYVTVKAVGQSVEGQWQAITTEAWERVEEFEETTDVPTLEDEGVVRAGSVEFTGSSIRETATFDAPYADAGYYATIGNYVASDGGIYVPAFDEATKAAGTIDILLNAPPGLGVTVRVEYIAVHG